jgi:hypothetical protein
MVETERRFARDSGLGLRGSKLGIRDSGLRSRNSMNFDLL